MENKVSRVIIDTNLWISFSITKDFTKLDEMNTRAFQQTTTTTKAYYMRKCLLPILTLALTTAVSGQSAFKKNDLYFELLGNGIGASINYERQLTSKPGLGLRAGVGYFSGDQEFRVSIPLGVNYLFSLSDNKSFLDAGIGGTWSGAAGLKKDIATGERDYSERVWSLVPSFGYRRHTKSNFMWRTSFSPIMNKYRIMPWIGISVGKRL